MPELQTPNLLPPMAGLALLSQIAERRQQNQLAYERMVQESALRQQNLAQEAALRREGFMVQRDRLAQELPLQQAQIKNYQSEIDHRVQLEKKALDQDAEATAERTKMLDQINAIDSRNGTNSYLRNLNDITSQYTDILGDPATQRTLRPIMAQYNMARKAGQQSFRDRATGYGFNDIQPFTNPQPFQGADEQDGKVMVFDKLPPRVVGNTIVPSQPIKVEKDKYDSLKTDYNDFFGGGNQPAPPAPPPVVQQPRVLTSDIARAYLNKAGGDKDKARAMAQADGFTF